MAAADDDVMLGISGIERKCLRRFSHPVHQLFFGEICDVTFNFDAIFFQDFNGLGIVVLHAGSFQHFHCGFMDFLTSFFHDFNLLF